MVSFSYREYLSTSGLASAAQVNFTINPRHVSLVVTFAVKLTFSGLTAERQKKKRKMDQQRISYYCYIVFYYASVQLLQDSVPLHRQHPRQEIVMHIFHKVLHPFRQEKHYFINY